ncbi:MAG: RNA polymerase sigma factor [Tsuneonella suprasediminis]|mgnify:FL=1|nr:sigma-70 family RNA polymerase sigma factor [Altericroceibacterium spongiae]
MPDGTRLSLRRSLVDGYSDLKRRLARRLGSAELASEALNETWIRLNQGGELGAIANADAYVYRTALNTAGHLLRREARHNSHGNLADIHELSDDQPLPDRVIAAREEVELMMAALAELPERQRTAFFKCFRGETSPEVLAEEYGVSVRTIQSDIRSAILHCAERTGRKNILAGQRVRHSRK